MDFYHFYALITTYFARQNMVKNTPKIIYFVEYSAKNPNLILQEMYRSSTTRHRTGHIRFSFFFLKIFFDFKKIYLVKNYVNFLFYFFNLTK